MNGNYRRWLIIGVDLLIVLGVYLVYSYFGAPASSNSVTISETLSYELKVSPPRSNTISIELSVMNPVSKPQSVNYPNGLILFLASGSSIKRKDNFWATNLQKPGKFELKPSEERTWSFSVEEPDKYKSPLYLVLFIDKKRQGKVRVPQT